jgi:hypothetical protein
LLTVFVFSHQLERFPDVAVLEATLQIVMSIQRGASIHPKLLSLVSRCLSILETFETISIRTSQGASQEFQGPEYKKHVFNVICREQWCRSNVLAYAKMFQGIQLSKEQACIRLCSSNALWFKH